LVTIGSGVSEGAGVEFPTFPLTCVVVLKTLWHYRASVWLYNVESRETTSHGWNAARGTWPAGTFTIGCWTDVGDCKDLRHPGFLSSQKRTVRFNRFWDQSARPYVRTSCRWWHLPSPSNSAPPGFTHAFQRGRKEVTPQAIIHTVTVQKPGIPSQRMGMGVAQLFRRPLGLGCYTDKMTDSLAPTTWSPYKGQDCSSQPESRYLRPSETDIWGTWCWELDRHRLVVCPTFSASFEDCSVCKATQSC